MTPTESNTALANNVTDIAAARQARDPKDTDTASAINVPKNRRFDKDKVARLKAAIADGSYKIDPSSIANKFIEHERN
ncbi:MAG: flagellar biosynthesis anti-sigma factor FlgM [Granulosicoccaceae bacterium]